ncbi:peptidase domain-containing ABC transporter [Kovacikia minuta CCNUW1]|uniref:peptidase domain-containing ABC transporter n=1 Tax=Kovacikia minuta TaxID=2931930 RepID=UPI001CCE1576|nr:peptidase domain-containing ABC transporter [Kovacikia minuta]UBF28399.1 peptidase domain-containing ABC transporter [Kovacikia minuta CCNUW1]
MKYAVFLQQNEEDCGAACLGAIAKHYGLNLSLTRLREAVGTGQQGTTLLGLKRGAETLGFNARSVRASAQILDRLSEAPLPAVIHWMGYHWVVLYGQQKQKYVIADPGVGLRYLTKEELVEGWTDWVMLLVEPDPARFYAQEGDPVRGIGSFFRRIWAYRALLTQVLLINLILGLLAISTPFLIQVLTDDVLVRGDLRLLNGLAIAVIILNLFSSGLGLVQSNLIAYFAQRLELGFVMEFGRAILRLPLTYYETHRSGEVVSRLRDIQEINQLVAQVVVSLPSQLFIALVSFAFMLFFSWKLTALAIVLGILMTISTLAFLPTLQQKTRSLLILETENQGVLVETFKGALTLKTTTATGQFWEEFQSRFGRLANLSYRTTQIGIINNVFSSLVSGIGAIVLLWFGSSLVISRELTIGQLLAFASLNGNVAGLISTVVKFVEEFTRAQTATQRLSEVINHTSETQGDSAKPFVRIPDNADIQCHQLTFHYPGRVDLLDNFSLTLPGGKVIALIGKSGCGKSTLAKLIAGLYTLQSGNIRIGAFNLPDLAIDGLRRQVVLVPQEPHFWSRSIIENFRLGTPDISFEQIVQVCQITGADEFISRLPEKYQTVLGEFGADLSGGQRQRLAIARALINDPPILILDESTAGLDPVSESQVLDELLSYREGKTTILISHRPRVISRADWIVLLDQGKLITHGPISDLRSKVGEHLEFLTP